MHPSTRAALRATLLRLGLYVPPAPGEAPRPTPAEAVPANEPAPLAA